MFGEYKRSNINYNYNLIFFLFGFEKFKEKRIEMCERIYFKNKY